MFENIKDFHLNMVTAKSTGYWYKQPCLVIQLSEFQYCQARQTSFSYRNLRLLQNIFGLGAFTEKPYCKPLKRNVV